MEANLLNIPFLIDSFFIALSAVPITLLVTFISLLIAIPLSLLLAISRINNIPIVSPMAKVYISFVRGTPIIVQIFVLYSSIPLILKGLFDMYDISYNVYDIHPLWYGFIIFSFHTTAILVEVFRSALLAVDSEQLEAAQSVGLSNMKAYQRIIIPQAMVVALPNLCTATVNLIKATSLGYAFSLQEITLKAKVAANFGYNFVEAYLDIFVVYMMLCMIVEYLFKTYENRLKRFRYAKE